MLLKRKSKADAQELVELFFDNLSVSKLADITEQIWRKKVSMDTIKDAFGSPSPGKTGQMFLLMERAGGPGLRARRADRGLPP
jgi:hypothetical protein